MPVTRRTPNKGGQTKRTTQSGADDAQMDDEQVQPTKNTAHVGDIQSTNTAQARELTPAEADTAQPSTSGMQPNDPMAQMLLMMQKTFNE